MIVGIAAAAAVGGSDVEQAVVGGSGPCDRVEGDLAAVVIGKRMRDPEELARGRAVVRGRLRVPGGPLEQNLVVRVPGSSRRRFTRAASAPASGIDANSTTLTLMTPSAAGIGSGNGLLVRPGPDGTYGPRPRPGNPWRPSGGGS